MPKTEFYKAGHMTSVDGLFSFRDREAHASRRRLMSHGYSQAAVNEFIPAMVEKVS